MSETQQVPDRSGADASSAPGYVPASDPDSVADALQAELLRRAATVATAESLTGGRLADALSAAPGSSDTYVGGVVSYATAVKRDVLGVSDETVDRYGVISAQCAEEMAAGARRLLRADYTVSTTGVAGPTTQEGKPVGLVFVGVAGPDGVTSRRFEMVGDRGAIREKVVKAAVDLALEVVTGAGGA